MKTKPINLALFFPFFVRFVRWKWFFLQQQQPLLHLLTGAFRTRLLFAPLQGEMIGITPRPAVSRSSARTAEPPGMDVKSGPSVLLSLISKLVFQILAGIGTILMINFSVVFICAGACVFTQTSYEKPSRWRRHNLQKTEYPRFCLPPFKL